MVILIYVLDSALLQNLGKIKYTKLRFAVNAKYRPADDEYDIEVSHFHS